MASVPDVGSWDGLSAVYPALLARLREKHPAADGVYFRDWLQVVEA